MNLEGLLLTDADRIALHKSNPDHSRDPDALLKAQRDKVLRGVAEWLRSKAHPATPHDNFAEFIMCAQGCEPYIGLIAEMEEWLEKGGEV